MSLHEKLKNQHSHCLSDPPPLHNQCKHFYIILLKMGRGKRAVDNLQGEDKEEKRDLERHGALVG